MQLKILVFMVFSVITCCHGTITFPSDMASMMDTRIDPCDDFYKYTCGGWMMTHKLKESDNQLKIDDIVAQKNKEIVEEIVRSGDHKVVRDLWDSCMNTDKMTELGNTPLQKDLKRIVEARTKQDVMKLAGEFSRTGANAFLNFTIHLDRDDLKTHTLYVDVAAPTLPITTSYSRIPLTKSNVYIEYINELLKLSGYTTLMEKSNHEEGKKVFAMETKLVDFGMKSTWESKKSLSYTLKRWPMTFAPFWEGVGIDSNQKMFYINKGYLDDVDHFLQSISIKDLKHYVAFTMVHSRVHWLGHTFYQVWFQYFGQTFKQLKEPSKRETICEESVIRNLADLIGIYFYDKTFNPDKEEYAFEMIELIKKAMGNHLDRASWLKPMEKSTAQTKLHNTISLVGTKVPKSYPSVLSRHDYPSNMYLIKSDRFDANMKKVGQHVNRHEWEEFSTKINAYYSLYKNAMIFPTTILQPPYFNGTNVHPARNFGAIGMVMGHELTHGFDSEASRWHLGGDAYRWSPETSTEYKKRTQCFVQQYSTLEVQGERGQVIGKVHGFVTSSENIADNGGITLAWDAYRSYMHKHKASIKEGDDQLFFIAFGQSMCAKTKDSYMRQFLETDPHSPASARVNGVVMNNQNFAKIFHCKPNARMNPINKCTLW